MKERSTNNHKEKRIFLNLEIKNKQKLEEFQFIKKRIKEDLVKTNKKKIYEPMKNTEVIRICLKMVYDYFSSQDFKNIQELKELKRSIIKDKIKLFSDE